MSDPNPFGNENPFADPSIQRATVNSQVAHQSLDDYNPFANNNTQSKPAAIITTNATNTYQPQSSQMQPEPNPPPYTNSSSQHLDLNQIEKQQDELNRRAAELDRREQLMNLPAGGGEKNFPPLPNWLPGPCKPCFYQDINREIPVEFQKWVRLLFYLWSFHALVLGFNIIAALVVWISGMSGATFAFSILYFVLFTPLSYVCWFRPAYKGFRNDDSVNFMAFFFVFFLQCIFSVISSFSGEWFCGMILLISVFSKITAHTAFACICVLITTIGFITIAVADILMMMKIHRLYRNTGASFEKAQKEFATNVMSNKNVQNAATTVITETARNAMQQQQQQQNSSSPGKF